MPGRAPLGSPRGDVLHIVLRDLLVIALTEGGFEHDTDRKRQFAEFGETRLFERIETEDDVFLFPTFNTSRDLNRSFMAILLW